MEPSPLSFRGLDTLDTLVENRTSLGGNDLCFSVYDTYQQASRVALRSTYPLYCGMITGKKVIRLTEAEAEPFEFVPGESLVLPPLETMYIDFPESDREPTRCITLEMDADKVDAIVSRMNDQMPRSPESGDWAYNALDYCHFANTDSINTLLETMVQLFDEDQPHRDMILDLNASELIVRMLQTESRLLLLSNSDRQATHNGLAAAVQYAKRHLDERITVNDLAEKACMSKSTFYRYFRNEFGMTPLQYLTELRMEHAREMLKRPGNTVTEVTAAVGFSSVGHFITTFRETFGQTPKQFQLSFQSETDMAEAA